MKYLLVTDDVKNKYIYLGKDKNPIKGPRYEGQNRWISLTSGNIFHTHNYLTNGDTYRALTFSDIILYYRRITYNCASTKDVYEAIREILREMADEISISD